jgi:hypothetical protein
LLTARRDARYYAYRDSAMSRLGPFRPEWIEELRVVSDPDPENPDVGYNNGHLMMQTTFFIGPVNFYYELRGKKYCFEANTGDSNFISPFVKHSFTSRDPDQQALIIAVTYGGAVRKALGDFARMGGERRARSHYRFVPPLIRFTPDSLTYSVSRFLNRQCDRTQVSDDGGDSFGPIRLHPDLVTPVCMSSLFAHGPGPPRRGG